MDEINKAEVVIGGQIITLKSSEDEEYMQRIGRYIDRKLGEIRAAKSNAAIHEKTRSVLIAVNVADDYFKALSRLNVLEGDYEKYVKDLARLNDENALLKKQARELKEQLGKAKAELEEYIKKFDGNNVVDLFKGKKAKESV